MDDVVFVGDVVPVDVVVFVAVVLVVVVDELVDVLVEDVVAVDEVVFVDDVVLVVVVDELVVVFVGDVVVVVGLDVVVVVDDVVEGLVVVVVDDVVVRGSAGGGTSVKVDALVMGAVVFGITVWFSSVAFSSVALPGGPPSPDASIVVGNCRHPVSATMATSIPADTVAMFPRARERGMGAGRCGPRPYPLCLKSRMQAGGTGPASRPRRWTPGVGPFRLALAPWRDRLRQPTANP